MIYNLEQRAINIKLVITKKMIAISASLPSSHRAIWPFLERTNILTFYYEYVLGLLWQKPLYFYKTSYMKPWGPIPLFYLFYKQLQFSNVSLTKLRFIYGYIFQNKKTTVFTILPGFSTVICIFFLKKWAEATLTCHESMSSRNFYKPWEAKTRRAWRNSSGLRPVHLFIILVTCKDLQNLEMDFFFKKGMERDLQ